MRYNHQHVKSQINPRQKPQSRQKYFSDIHSDNVERNSSDTRDVSNPQSRPITTCIPNPNYPTVSNMDSLHNDGVINKTVMKDTVVKVVKSQVKTEPTNYETTVDTIKAKPSGKAQSNGSSQSFQTSFHPSKPGVKEVNFWIETDKKNPRRNWKYITEKALVKKASSTKNNAHRKKYDKGILAKDSSKIEQNKDISNQKEENQSNAKSNIAETSKSNGLEMNEPNDVQIITETNVNHQNSDHDKYVLENSVDKSSQDDNVDQSYPEIDDAGDKFSTPMRRKMRKGPAKPRRAIYFTKEMGYYRQCFQPRFEAPKTWGDFFHCRSRDFVFVSVGLCNIIILQFALVVIMYCRLQEQQNYG